jgi:nucleoside-diphosphate-sugar epimerase
MSISGKRIFLTGGAGFIGSTICQTLIDDNEIVVFDNGYRNAIRYTDLANHKNLRFIQGSVLDYEAVLKGMEGCQIVVHLAAIAGVPDVFKHPVMTMKVPLLGTYHALEAALHHGIERFVDFSTSEVFGSYAFRVHEADVTSLGAVGEARWTYAVSKLATEHLAHNYCKEFGLPTVSVRPFNIYGPRQVGAGAVHEFIDRALRGEDLVVHNDGSQIRAWCYIDDIVSGVLLSLEKDAAVGEAFNIGNPRCVITVYNLAREIIRLCESKSRIVFEEVDRADVEIRVPSIKKARALLQYEPKIDLEEGLLKTIDWYREIKDAETAAAAEPVLAQAAH